MEDELLRGITNRFKTAHGEWLLRVDIGALRRIRSHLCVDLIDMIASGDLASIGDDWVLIGEIAWELVEPSALRRGLDRTMFLQSINGDTLVEISRALIAALMQSLPACDKKDRDCPNQRAIEESSATDHDTWIARMSAIIGFDPSHMTIRELVDAVKTMVSYQWDHTAVLLCQTANLHRAERSPPIPIWKFHPLMTTQKERRKGMSVAQIRAFANVMPTVKVRIDPETGEQVVIND